MSAALKLPPDSTSTLAFHKKPVTKRITVEEYEAILEKSEVKLQFIDGQIITMDCEPYIQGIQISDMAGGGSDHSLVKVNTVGRFSEALRKRRCRVFDSDMKVQVEASSTNCFPDVSIVCGRPEYKDERQITLLNPGVIVEVLSPSTEAADRGRKFWNYRQIPSLHTYILISTEEPLVEVYELNAENHWQLATFRGLDSTLTLRHCEVHIPLRGLYEKTDLDPEWVDGTQGDAQA